MGITSSSLANFIFSLIPFVGWLLGTAAYIIGLFIINTIYDICNTWILPRFNLESSQCQYPHVNVGGNPVVANGPVVGGYNNAGMNNYQNNYNSGVNNVYQANTNLEMNNANQLNTNPIIDNTNQTMNNTNQINTNLEMNNNTTSNNTTIDNFQNSEQLEVKNIVRDAVQKIHLMQHIAQLAVQN